MSGLTFLVGGAALGDKFNFTWQLRSDFSIESDLWHPIFKISVYPLQGLLPEKKQLFPEKKQQA